MHDVDTYTTGTGYVEADYQWSNDDSSLFNNMWLSFVIRRGKWALRPDFGLDFPMQAKRTPGIEPLLKSRTERAMQWIIDTGRAQSISVTVSQDVRPTWLIVECEAIDPEGEAVTFTTFQEVI